MVADDPDIRPYLDNTESLKIKTNDFVLNDDQAEQTKEVLELLVTNLISLLVQILQTGYSENTAEEPDHYYNLIGEPLEPMLTWSVNEACIFWK